MPNELTLCALKFWGLKLCKWHSVHLLHMRYTCMAEFFLMLWSSKQQHHLSTLGNHDPQITEN